MRATTGAPAGPATWSGDEGAMEGCPALADIEIGSGKSGRQAYSLDDIALVPSRRTRDPNDVDLSWSIDAYTMALPLMVSAADAVVSPATAVAIGRLGGLAVLNLEGLWTRYEDPTSLFEEISSLPDDALAGRLRQLYAADIRPELVAARIREVAAAGVVTCASLSPKRTAQFAKTVVEAELDLLVVQGAVVSAEHVSSASEPLNLKRFIREYDIPVVVGGCASYQVALHLMRAGAAGILVGVGTGYASTTRAVLGLGPPQGTAIADAAGARGRHLEETGVYAQVIADGGMTTGGDIAKAIACGADAVMIGAPLAAATEAPGKGWYWDMSAGHESLPRGGRVRAPVQGTLAEVLLGPAPVASQFGRVNLFGALRASMAMCGYATVREFHKAEVTVRA